MKKIEKFIKHFILLLNEMLKFSSRLKSTGFV